MNWDQLPDEDIKPEDSNLAEQQNSEATTTEPTAVKPKPKTKQYLKQHKIPEKLKGIDRRFKTQEQKDKEQFEEENYTLPNTPVAALITPNLNKLEDKLNLDKTLNPDSKEKLIKPTEIQKIEANKLLLAAKDPDEPETPTYDRLKGRQKILVEEYLLDYNRQKAMKRAGYSQISAASVSSEYFNKPHIIKSIAEKESQILYLLEKKRTVSKKYIIEVLKENITRAMQQKPVLDKQGQPTGEYLWSGSVVVSSCKLLGEYLKMWGANSADRGEDKGTVLILPQVMNVQQNVYNKGGDK